MFHQKSIVNRTIFVLSKVSILIAVLTIFMEMRNCNKHEYIIYNVLHNKVPQRV